MAIIPARPTTYSGIPMRSRLEARFAAFLDNADFDWEYEPRAFGSPSGQYLPDFRVFKAALEDDFYVEIKGVINTEAEHRSARQRLEIIHASHPGAGLALVVDDSLGVSGLTFWVKPSSRIRWIKGGIGVCARGRAHFFGMHPKTGGPVPFTFCGDDWCLEIKAYLDPFVR